MSRNAIEVRGVRRKYVKGPQALDGVDLDVAAGSAFALLGPNGAGKSTLTRILCTLSRADAGMFTIDGIASGGDTKRIRGLIGVALQDPQIDPAATVCAQLVFQCLLFGFDRKRAQDRAEELLARFGLAENAERKAGDLSGGNKRRLHVALALAHAPRVLFLDEPTVGMDPEIRAGFWNEIRRCRTEEGMTVFFTTQYLDEAERHADDLAIIDRGMIVWRGEVAAFVKQHEAAPGAGLESGYLEFLEAQHA